MADPRSVLIVGERPERNDFADPAIPKGMTPEKIRDGIPGLMRLQLHDRRFGWKRQPVRKRFTEEQIVAVLKES